MQFAEIFWRVLYPALSLLQNNDKNFTRLLYLMAKSLNLIITFICVMIFILFDDFVLLFLGANWEPMIDIVKIFCVYCWSLSFIIPFQIAIQAMGAPKNLTIVNLINLIIIISTIVPASNYYGIQGVILAQIFSSSISLIFLYKSLRVISNIQIFKHLQLILASFIAASLSVFFNTHIYKLLVIPNNYFDVIIEVVVAISLFVVITLVLEYLFSKKSPRVLLNELYDLVFN